MENVIDKVGEVQLAYRPTTKQRTKITSSADSYEYLLNRCFNESTICHHEEFKVLFLNNAMQVLGWSTLSSGGLTDTLVDVRVVIQYALLMNATLLIAAHNHPSGSVHPSRDDDRLTENLQKACTIMNIKFMDHLIVTPDAYYSYNDEGRL